MNEEKYEWIRAEIEDGYLSVHFKLVGLPPDILDHEDDLADISESAVRALTRKLLGVDEADPVKVEVTYL